MRCSRDAYAPDVPVRSEPTASPLRASLGTPRPATRAGAHRRERRAARRGRGLRPPAVAGRGQRRRRPLLGTIHDFLLLNPIAGSGPTCAAVAQVTDTLRAACSTVSGSPGALRARGDVSYPPPARAQAARYGIDRACGYCPCTLIPNPGGCILLSLFGFT